MNMKGILSLILLASALAAFSQSGDRSEKAKQTQRVIVEQKSMQEMGLQSQKRIAALDDETRELLNQYRSELERLKDLETYNRQLDRMLESQNRERDRIESSRADIENLKRDTLPLMMEMIATLEQFVALDKPFLAQERNRRLDALRRTFDRADVALPEKFRRLMEAYQVEAEYGRTIESYEGVIERDGDEMTVEMLRFGRVGLYYLSLDHRSAGFWNEKKRQWETLPDSAIEDIEKAIRVARRQAPAKILELPMPTAEVRK